MFPGRVVNLRARDPHRHGAEDLPHLAEPDGGTVKGSRFDFPSEVGYVVAV